MLAFSKMIKREGAFLQDFSVEIENFLHMFYSRSKLGGAAMKIRTKWTILFSGVTVGLLLLAATTGYYFVQTHLTKTFERDLATQMSLHAENLNNSLLSKEKMLAITWHNLHNTVQDGQVLESMLSGYTAVDPELSDMYFGTVTGRLIDGSGWQAPEGYDARTRPWYQAALAKGSITVSDPYFEMVTQRLVVGIVMPVTDQRGKLLGVVGADIPLATLADNLALVRPYEGAYAYLINSKGQMLAHPEPAFVAKYVDEYPKLASIQKVFTQMQTQKRGILPYRYNDINKLAVFEQLADADWIMVLTVPEKEVYRPLQRVALWFLFFTLLTMAVVVWLTAKVAKRITQPLEALAAQVRSVGDGNLAVRAETCGDDEMVELATGFNGMVIGLRSLVDKINYDAEKTVMRLQAFQEVTGHLVAVGTTDELFAVITRDITKLVGSVYSLIATVDEAKQCWCVRHISGTIRQMNECRNLCMPLGSGVVGEAIEEERLVFVSNYHTYKKRLVFAEPQEFTSCIAIPLKIDGKTVGALMAGWRDQLANVEEKTSFILQQYANIAAAALEQAKNREDMHKMAFSDALTGLPNRRYFYQTLQERLKEGALVGEGAVLLLDLDNLKLINDSFGHSHGDEIIQSIGGRMQKVVGDNCIVARLGGDEFSVWASNQTEAGVFELARNLLAALERWEKIDDQYLHITASCGVAFYPKDGQTAEELLQKADIALYEAKYAGKNTWRVYTEKMQEKTREKLLLSNGLRGAIERNELSLAYQPLVSSDRQVIGFEALLRWNSLEYGAIPPAKFIPIAEQGHMMDKIGKWVLQEAGAFAHRLKMLGANDLQTHVNVSVRQLERDNFVETVETAVRQAEIEPEQLVLEITESVLMKSVEQAVKRLQELKEKGFLIAMDDFGEGFSSLAQLRRLPVMRLKISRTLIQQLGEDDRQLDYIKAIVEMMHILGMKVVAEGVETESEWQATLACQFDYVQGYYFSRPLSPKDALDYWRNHRSASDETR